METATTPTKTGLKYGLIIGIILTIFGLVIQFLDLDMKTSQYLGWVSYVGLIIGIVIACNDFKKNNSGYMNFGQGLGIGTLLSTIAGLLQGVFFYIYVKFIDDSIFGKIRDAQVVEMEKQNISDEQMEQALNMADKFTSPEILTLITIISTVFMGFVFSLIISAILQKKNPEFDTLDAR